MHNEIKKKYPNLSINLIIFLIPLASLYNTKSLPLRILGSFIILLIFLTCLITLFKKIFNKNIIKFFLSSLLIIAVYVFDLILNSSFNGIKLMIQLIILLTCFFSMMEMRLSNINYNTLKISLGVIILLCYLPSINGIVKTYGGWSSIYGVSNFLGIFCLFMGQISFLIYKIKKQKIFILYIVLLVVLMMLSKTRTALMGLIIFMCLYMITNKINKKTVWFILKYTIFIGLVAITIIYPNLTYFSWYDTLSEIVFNVTGKILMSGREVIWKEGVNLVLNNFIIGYGFDITERFNLLLHNSYLAICVQSGIIGLFAILIFINTIINSMIRYRYNFIIRICFCFFITNLLVSSFEVMLFQGQIVLSLTNWIIAGLSLNPMLIKKDKKLIKTLNILTRGTKFYEINWRKYIL